MSTWLPTLTPHTHFWGLSCVLPLPACDFSPALPHSILLSALRHLLAVKQQRIFEADFTGVVWLQPWSGRQDESRTKTQTRSDWKRGLTCFSVEKFLFAVHAEWVIMGGKQLDVTPRSCFHRRPGPCRAAALSEHPRQPDGSPATRTARYRVFVRSETTTAESCQQRLALWLAW